MGRCHSLPPRSGPAPGIIKQELLMSSSHSAFQITLHFLQEVLHSEEPGSLFPSNRKGLLSITWPLSLSMNTLGDRGFKVLEVAYCSKCNMPLKKGGGKTTTEFWVCNSSPCHRTQLCRLGTQPLH